MALLEPGLLTRLKRSRLLPRQARATTGVGERRSRAKGLGLEFEEYREYQPGDDIRHLDRHVHARLGLNVVRQYSLSQQMSVTVVIDCSASMAFGAPSKHRMATRLAAMLAFIAVAGGDRIRVGACTSGRMKWHAVCSSQRQTASLFRWLESLETGGTADLRQLARLSGPRLQPGGLLVVISDLMAEGHDDALGIWRANGQEVVELQVLSPAELDPEQLGSGPVSLIDGETGVELDMNLAHASLESYREVLTGWLKDLRTAVHSRNGRHHLISSDADLENTVLSEWRQQGLVR